jgi:hypothetical protein
MQINIGGISLTAVRQTLNNEQLNNPQVTVLQSIREQDFFAAVKAGESVCIGLPSRGIRGLSTIVKTCVDEILRVGGRPFIVPAMGSHGGGNAEGQMQVLAEAGITEESMKAPIRSSMKAVPVGSVNVGGSEMPVLWDEFACQADHVMVINRIKPHTAFTGRIESGLAKILTVGLGKADGARAIHQAGLAEGIITAAQYLMETRPVLGGIAIVENGLHAPMLIEAVPAKTLLTRESELLEIARSTIARIPFDTLDVLIIREMGKDLSGTGIDTNVIGKYRRNWGEPSPNYRRIVVLDLTDASHGNATGVGFADVITRRLYDKIDRKATWLNCLTAENFNGAKIPMVAEDDDEAVGMALSGLPLKQARVVLVQSTLALETLWVSDVLLGECEARGLTICL